MWVCGWGIEGFFERVMWNVWPLILESNRQQRRTMDEFTTMKEIGVIFGVSSHAIGRKLKELGLRTKDHRPSAAAFAAGLVQQKFTQDHANYLWAWRVPTTVALLEEAGLEKVGTARRG